MDPDSIEPPTMKFGDVFVVQFYASIGNQDFDTYERIGLIRCSPGWIESIYVEEHARDCGIAGVPLISLKCSHILLLSTSKLAWLAAPGANRADNSRLIRRSSSKIPAGADNE